MKRIIYLVLVLFTVSCSNNENRIFEENQSIDDGVWQREDVKSFKIKIDDISQAYRIYYSIRNTVDYPYYNLYLKHALVNEAGDTLSSRLQHMDLFHEQTGKPLGNGSSFSLSGGSMGDLFDHRIQCLDNIKFEEKGEYTFIIKQYMREGDSIDGLFSIGCRVEKIPN